ncbi:MAG: hypothetical protein AAF492_21585 [Verrucomicrobiota bacterium]
MRYIVDALWPPEDAAAKLFEERPDEGRYFQYQWGNRKYRVFKILTRRDERMAEEYSREAEAAFQEGRLDEAATAATRALKFHFENELAIKILGHVNALKEKGFSLQPDEKP